MLCRAGSVFNHKFDTAERLFHLRSINNVLHTKIGKSMTDTPPKPAHKYMQATKETPKHKRSCKYSFEGWLFLFVQAKMYTKHRSKDQD